MFFFEKEEKYLNLPCFVTHMLPRKQSKRLGNPMNITKNFINSLVYTDTEQCFFDDALKGFGVRIRKSSASYIVLYRNSHGQQKKMTLCKVSQMTPTQAREEARLVLADVVRGFDPQAAKKERRHASTVAGFVDEYMEMHVALLKASTQRTYEVAVRLNIKPMIGNLIIKDIRRGDMQRFYNDLVVGKSLGRKLKRNSGYKYIGIADRAMRVLSGMFEYAIDLNIIEHNPCMRLKKLPPKTKDIFLDSNEIKTFGHILNTCNYKDEYSLNILRLLLMTGCRKEEIVKLKWSYIDFERQIFRFPDTKTGPQNRPFGVAVKLLLEKLKAQCLPKTLDSRVFPRTEHTLWIVQSVFLRKIKTVAGFENLCPHALRHSFNSVAAEMGYSDAIMAKLLGHKLKTVTHRYTHFTETKVIEAADKVSLKIAELLDIDLQNKTITQ